MASEPGRTGAINHLDLHSAIALVGQHMQSWCSKALGSLRGSILSASRLRSNMHKASCFEQMVQTQIKENEKSL